MKTSVSRLGCPLEMTLKSDRQSQIRPNCYHALRLLGDLDQISSFASNYEPITLPIQPQLGILLDVGVGWILILLCPESLFGLLFLTLPFLLLLQLLLFSASNIRPQLTILDYQLPCD